MPLKHQISETGTINRTRRFANTEKGNGSWLSGPNDNGSMNWKQTCITEVQAAVRDAKPTATQLAERCFQEIEAQNQAINAYLTVSRERALHAAAAIDQLAAQAALCRRWPVFPSGSRTYW